MSSLRIVKKNKSYSVYHDDSYIGFIYKKDFKDLAIRFSEEGEFFIEDTSPETIEDIKALIIRRAFDKAVGYATVSECSSGIIRNKLRMKYYPDYAIDACIEMMYDYNYINDERFVESYTRCYLNSKSRYLIERELETKGIDLSDKKHILDEVYAEIELSDEDIIASLVERKFRGQDINDEKVRRRVVSFLIRHGFTFDKINNYLT